MNGQEGGVWSKKIKENDMKKQRDFQRRKVYNAEWATEACCFPIEKLTLDECKQLIEKASRFTKGPRPIVKDGRGCRKARGSAWHIVLPKWARTKWTVLHEYAHAVTTYNHGPDFVKAYLKLVKRFIGRTEADILRMAFRQYKVRTRKRVEKLF